MPQTGVRASMQTSHEGQENGIRGLPELFEDLREGRKGPPDPAKADEVIIDVAKMMAADDDATAEPS